MKYLSKHTRAFNLILLMLFAISFPKLIFAAENIINFDTEFHINSDTSVNVIEEIDYDFGSAERHGIFREIPVKYKARGGSYAYRLSEVSVTDENGKSYNFSQSTAGDNISLKIGDADKLVTGEKTYIISYKIKRALNYFENHDEFYWNAIGNGWDVPISNVSAKVVLPQETSDIKSECFIGYFGSQEKCASDIVGNREINFSSRDLLSNEGVTVVVGFPKGIVTPPSLAARLWETLKDNIIMLLPVIVFLIMLNLWKKKGKDPQGRGTIIAQYDAPENLTPLEIGTLVDENAQTKDVSAQIIHLAVQGYLKIIKTQKKILLFNTTDYEFEKLKDASGLENDFDREIMKGLFTEDSGIGKKVKMSALKEKFYKNLKNILNYSYVSLVKKGYFPKNPKTVITTYFLIGLFTAFTSFFVAALFGAIGVVSMIVSGVIIIGFAFIMPVKTQQGVLAYEHILGLKKYLTVAEKDRLDFHNAPAKNPAHFESLLPYAMALGVHKEWSEQFTDIYDKAPSWYTDTTGAHFTSIALTNSLVDFSTSVNTTIASAPSSSAGGGSGFSGGGSGGGGGGGGGGSW